MTHKSLKRRHSAMTITHHRRTHSPSEMIVAPPIGRSVIDWVRW